MTAQTALGFAVLGAVLIFVLRESKSPLAPLLSLFAGTLLLSAALARYAESELFTVLASLSEKEETKTVFKVLSVGLLTEIGADPNIFIFKFIQFYAGSSTNVTFVKLDQLVAL